MNEDKNFNPNIREQAYKEFHRLILTITKELIKNQNDAEDITGQCFLKLCEKTDIESMTKNNIKGFLIVTARNLTVDYWRKRRSVNNWLSNQEVNEMDLYDEDLELETLIGEYINTLLKLIQEEPEQRKKILKLFYLHGKKNHEISAELNISPHTVKNALTKCKDSLRKKLKKLGLWKE